MTCKLHWFEWIMFIATLICVFGVGMGAGVVYALSDKTEIEK